MQVGWVAIYVIIFFQALLVSLFLTPVAGVLGLRLGLVDVPSQKKIHTTLKPRSGGIAIVLSFMFVLILDLVLAFAFGGSEILSRHVAMYMPNIRSALTQLVALLAGGMFIFIMGLVDDRIMLRPTQKLLLQIVAIVPLLLTGIKIVMFLPHIVGVILTVFWILLMINAFNFIDNMDGLSSGVAVIVLLFLSYLSYRAGEVFMVAILIMLAGSALGFLRYNFYPSRLFMGDCGSMFIGYMIGSLTVLSTYYQAGTMPTRLPVLIPLIVLGVPIFDTVSVVLIRFKTGKPIMMGDKNHFSHRLVNLGFTQPQAVVFIYLVTICVAMNALPLRYLDTRDSIIQFCQTVLLFVIIFILEYVGKKRGTTLSNSGQGDTK